MSEHLPRSTECLWKWCYHCKRLTEHQVSGGRIGRCVNSHAKPATKPNPTPAQPTLWDKTKGAP